jgi:hypothetical protein
MFIAIDSIIGVCAVHPFSQLSDIISNEVTKQ